MAELEYILEKRLIEELTRGESQWTYRKDIKSEDALWKNFKYILEQNNKAALDDIPLSETEFEKIKNDVSHPSFYEAGKWLRGENGEVQVHLMRGNKPLHLTVMNHEHIAGGSSVYEVINQYQSHNFVGEEEERKRRFDVTLLINGLPLIHIELKNKSHSYMEGFHQIKKYIAEGKFRGIFSNVQMFVVSNEVDTKYFPAARDIDLNEKFLNGWLDSENKPVCVLSDFTKSVLKIPEAHEMISKYTVLDNEKKLILLLRPYQIHAIESMRRASKVGKSGFIWHTTGSGKTMTSYKATRNLLMDIPSIDKTIFLIDRRDLDTQTSEAFQSYAENDTIDVNDTDNVNALIEKLSDGKRTMLVTTRQKMQIMINRRLKEGSRAFEKIRKLKIAFVVDECHRAVTPETKREIEKFFTNSLWFGFTGTPIFEENKYEQLGDLAQTTEELYGEILHSYTIKEAIHDRAVLGFNVENLGVKDIKKEDEEGYYHSEHHMRQVLNIILNQSMAKFGMQRGRGQTYEAMLTVDSIAMAQKYYNLLKNIKEGRDELVIREEVKRTLPDFPKVAITFSVSENEEASKENQDAMKSYLKDYYEMFGPKYKVEDLRSYNDGLNKRLARKGDRYKLREEQLDLVIVVDRLLTGFDAPCLSTLFIDRKFATPQLLIQAFSRTNRLFDKNKEYGFIVTFRSPEEYKEQINKALVLYSNGGFGKAIAEDWDEVFKNFKISLKAIREFADDPLNVPGLSINQKKIFVQLFRALDSDYAHLKSFSSFEPVILEEFSFSEELYEDYAAVYRNVVEELKKEREEKGEDEDFKEDYELVAFHRFKIDFEYIVGLLQGFVDLLDTKKESENEEGINAKLTSLKEIVREFSEDNASLSEILMQVIKDIEKDRERFIGQDISVFVHELKEAKINKHIEDFSKEWYLNHEDVKYEALSFRNGELSNENKLKESAHYKTYKEENPEGLPKFKFNSALVKGFKEDLMPKLEELLREY